MPVGLGGVTPVLGELGTGVLGCGVVVDALDVTVVAGAPSGPDAAGSPQAAVRTNAEAFPSISQRGFVMDAGDERRGMTTTQCEQSQVSAQQTERHRRQASQIGTTVRTFTTRQKSSRADANAARLNVEPEAIVIRT